LQELLDQLGFRGTLRPSQAEAVAVARAQLAAGQRHLHVVAPPGSGKTVLGLYLWAEVIRAPAVVLSPNSAIQAQWTHRVGMFAPDGADRALASTDPLRPAALTSLTYQSVTLPARGNESSDQTALDLWIDRLVAGGQAEDPDEAAAWIDDLRRHNPDYHEKRLSAARRQVREEVGIAGEGLATLHESALGTLKRLADAEVGLMILDECHHLMGHWGRVLDDADELLGHPMIIGLTATPPDTSGRRNEDIDRYNRFLGPVDFTVLVPALVRDGYLAPYQDLAYFVRPTPDELAFVANTDAALTQLVEGLSAPRDEPERTLPLPEWTAQTLRELRIGPAHQPTWSQFEARTPHFALAARVFLLASGQPLPPDAPQPPEGAPDANTMDVLVPVLEQYIRHGLRTSPDPQDHALADRAIRRLRVLGVQVTETGAQACASPVSRVMAYSTAKARAIVPILTGEMDSLGDRIRAIVVADYERTSAVAPEIEHLLDDEAGGAIAAFRTLLTDPKTDALDPVLVTGSTVLVDDDLYPAFQAGAEKWIADRGLAVQLQPSEEDGFHVLTAAGADWCPRNYVAMVTALFQAGVTRCLVGTRGLLGEGWDASKVNVLIDLTAVTTTMSVNQLRGRSIRLDGDDPSKLANNWDVVCIAPEFRKGLDDYRRFISRHGTIFGITDDGAIEKGVGHVHPAFTEIEPEGVEGAMGALNADMLARALRRDEARTLWKVGTPYNPEPIKAVEARNPAGSAGGFPPYAGEADPWSDASLAMQVGLAVLGAMREAGILTGAGDLSVGRRAGGYVRLFLTGATEADTRIFADAVAEALGPLDEPRYIVPRKADFIDDTWVSRLLPEVLAKYFRRRRRELVMWHAVPTPLARNRDLAAVYARYWNLHVSPGPLLFVQRGSGREVLQRALRNGLTPTGQIHDKTVFL